MKRNRCDCCQRADTEPGSAWCAACRRICAGMDHDYRFHTLLKIQPPAVRDEREARILGHMIRVAAKLAQLGGR